jgi:hypothetical protein
VLLFILLGVILFAIYDIEKRGAGDNGSSSPGDRRDEIPTDEDRLNTPRNERDIQKARQDGTLREGE